MPWPEDYIAWADAAAPLAVQRLHDRLAKYRLLRVGLAKRVEAAVNLALDEAAQRRAIPRYWPNRVVFERWLCVRSFKIALRLAVAAGQPIHRWLDRLADDLRCLLLWHYLDPLADFEIGRLLGIGKDDARSRLMVAHKALGDLLIADGVADDDWTFPLMTGGSPYRRDVSHD